MNDDCLVFDKYGLLSKLYGSSTAAVAKFAYMDPDERAYTNLVVADAGSNQWLDIKNHVSLTTCLCLIKFFL